MKSGHLDAEVRKEMPKGKKVFNADLKVKEKKEVDSHKEDGMKVTHQLTLVDEEREYKVVISRPDPFFTTPVPGQKVSVNVTALQTTLDEAGKE